MEEMLPFSEPSYIASPYAHWKRLRDGAPVYWSKSSGFWAITRYDDVLEVVHDPVRFSSRLGPTGLSEEKGVPRLPMIQDDPPDHDRVRRILSKAFTPRTTTLREERVREIARSLKHDLQARIAAGEQVDLVSDFSSPLPVLVIAEILGIPEELHRSLLLNENRSVNGPAGIAEERTPSPMQEIHAILAELIEARRSHREDDLVSALIEASENDESPLRPEEVVGLCTLLWVAGNETTTNLLSNAALVLQEQPDLIQAVRSDPAGIPATVEEMLRLQSPLNCLARSATKDLEFRGSKIHEGDVIMVMFGSANRDPRHFDRPEEFNSQRRPNDHVAFGHGIHYCLGAHLARLEARIGLEVLGELLPTVRLRPDLGTRIPTGVLRGWIRLPMEPQPS